ncbi:MAG: hypothetical protein NW201_01475 [Gemmatimonadales bacterium]|nr:hypothetical protein [Gemmatimonadales bacterium]
MRRAIGGGRTGAHGTPRAGWAAALLMLAGGPLVLPSALAAQDAVGGDYRWTMPAAYREVQLRAQETQRKLLLQMADSMPERHYRESAEPGQRHFAAQLHHVAAADVYIVSKFQLEAAPPTLPDTATTFASRDGLKRFINAAYDYSIKALREQPDAERQKSVFYFGQRIPKWLIWDELNQHSIWTIGQVVANFRRHGMAPPAFSYY